MITVQCKKNQLSSEEKEQIWEILCECDKEFYPWLSAREGSSQKQLVVDEAAAAPLPVTYFNEMIRQEFLIAQKDGRIVAFMTFKTDYLCDALAAFGTSLYVTTVCVRHENRREGAMKALYDFLEKEVPSLYRCNKVSTRTWSLNEAQLHELSKRGYEKLAVLLNDRGNGVDTIYFGKVCG